MTANPTKLTKVIFGPEDSSLRVIGYGVSDRATGESIGVVYKRTRTSHVYGNNGRSRITTGTVSDTRWYHQVGTLADWSWLTSRDRGFAYTRTDAVDELMRSAS